MNNTRDELEIIPHDVLKKHEKALLQTINNPTLLKWDLKERADTGRSGARVFISLATYDQGLSAYQVFKFNTVEKLQKEHDGWDKYVKNGLSRFHGVPIKYFKDISDNAMIVYDCASANAEFVSFKKLFRNTPDPNNIKTCIKHIFTDMLNPWFEKTEFSHENLFQTITSDLDKEQIEKIEKHLNSIIAGEHNYLSAKELKFEHWAKKLPNPLLIDSLNNTTLSTVLSPQCVVHGDLNSENILLFEEKALVKSDAGTDRIEDIKHISLIDYAYTGGANAFVDLATLEAVIKFQLIEQSSETLHKILEFEDYCLSNLELTLPGKSYLFANDTELVKALTVITELRLQAKRILNRCTRCKDISYWAYLYIYTMNHIIYDGLSPNQKQYALASAGMIMDKHLLKGEQ